MISMTTCNRAQWLPLVICRCPSSDFLGPASFQPNWWCPSRWRGHRSWGLVGLPGRRRKASADSPGETSGWEKLERRRFAGSGRGRLNRWWKGEQGRTAGVGGGRWRSWQQRLRPLRRLWRTRARADHAHCCCCCFRRRRRSNSRGHWRRRQRKYQRRERRRGGAGGRPTRASSPLGRG